VRLSLIDWFLFIFQLFQRDCGNDLPAQAWAPVHSKLVAKNKHFETYLFSTSLFPPPIYIYIYTIIFNYVCLYIRNLKVCDSLACCSGISMVLSSCTGMGHRTTKAFVCISNVYLISFSMYPGWSEIRIPAGAGNFSLHHRVQIVFGAHPASYLMGTRESFSGNKAAGAWSWPLTSI
jgi:hypothetical protein